MPRIEGPLPPPAAPIARRAVTVNSRPFLNAHGREPRGRGSWAFRPPHGGPIIWANGTYAAARRDAVAWAAAHGVDEIDTLS